MNTYADKHQGNKSQLVANSVAQQQSGSESTFQFVDNRPEADKQRKQQEMTDKYSSQQYLPIQMKENDTGLPNHLKSGIENLSGYSVNDVTLEKEADVMGEKALDSTKIPVTSSNLIQAKSPKVIQSKFYTRGEWMQEVSDEVLLDKFGATTSSLWKAMRDSDAIVPVWYTGSGASFNFETKVLSISEDWLTAIKHYVETGEKSDIVGRAISGLTHELSHAHDHFIKDETPKGKDKSTDMYVIAVLRTELKAWMKEARSARENKKDKNIPAGDDNSKLITSWLGVYFSIKEGKNILKSDIYENQVIGRLEKYFNDNKSDSTDTTLQSLLEDKSNGLLADIANYATQIRNKYTSGDEILRPIAADAIAS